MQGKSSFHLAPARWVKDLGHPGRQAPRGHRGCRREGGEYLRPALERAGAGDGRHPEAVIDKRVSANLWVCALDEREKCMSGLYNLLPTSLLRAFLMMCAL